MSEILHTKYNDHQIVGISSKLNQSKKIKGINVKNSYVVNEIVNTKAYHDKFEKLPFPKEVREALYNYSLEILNQRNGTAIETAYAIDARTGSFIISSSTEVVFKSSFSKSEFEKINSNLNSVIFIHNHLNGGRISYGDLCVLYKNKKCCSIMAIGHNGDVYVCVKNDKINFSEIEIFYNKVYNSFTELYDKITAQYFALDVVYEKYDVRVYKY